jgi:hypothetical protein
MIGGYFVDACVIAAIAAFGWAGGQLGGRASVMRTVCGLVAFVVAVLLCSPAGRVIGAVTSFGPDTCRIIGTLLVGFIVWMAVASLLRSWLVRRDARRYDDEWDLQPADPLDRGSIATIAGALFGLGWAAIFLSLLVMLPADTVVSRAAVSSAGGGLLIRQESGLRWLDRHFSHYTQALPKGKLGAEVGDVGELPMRGAHTSADIPGDADALLLSINAIRRNADTTTLEPNRALATIAQRQADALAEDHRLSPLLPGGATLDAQVRAALGADSGLYRTTAGVLVAWALSPGNANGGFIADSSANAQLRDPKWGAVGIGASSAGWFNGHIYVVVLVAPTAAASADATTDSSAGDGIAADSGNAITDDSPDPRE